MGVPKVTVLMSVYNGEKFLKEAVESILNQTFQDFEFLIIDDCSTDLSLNIIESYSDERIRIIKNDVNIGLTKSLNKGLTIAKGKYIARMDADDFSLPKRLEKQVKYMELNDDVGMCGTSLKTIGSNIQPIWEAPISHEAIFCNFLFNSPLYHPTVIIRKKVIKENQLFYHVNIRVAQDYDFWVRASQFTKLANLSEVLLLYRLHGNSVSTLNKTSQSDTANNIRLAMITKLIPDTNTIEIELHNRIATWNIYNNFPIFEAEKWLRKLAEANEKVKYFPKKEFLEMLSEKWFSICSANRRFGFWLKSLILDLFNESGFKFFHSLLFSVKSFITYLKQEYKKQKHLKYSP